MFAACAECGLSGGFFFLGGGGGLVFVFLGFFFVFLLLGRRREVGRLYLRSICPFPTIFSFSSSFLADGLILDETCQRANKSKTTNPPAIQGRITKSDRSLEYFLNFNIVLPKNETVHFVFSCLILYYTMLMLLK